MGDDDTRDDDLDRAAILARRQRFIALALSGLATAGACTPSDAPPKDDSSRARPSACLKYSLEPRQPKPNAPNPPTPDATPTPCLAVPIDGQIEPQPETDTAAPQVCLSAVPREPVKPSGAAPCLSVVPTKKPTEPATPRPCLKVAPPDDDDD